MSGNRVRCSWCGDEEPEPVDRREFLAAASAGVLALGATASAKPAEKQKPETLVKLLYQSFNEQQKKEICFSWDHQKKGLGLLRTHISNNWRITKPAIKSGFYSAEQQQLIRDIFVGLINPDWVTRFDKQFKDDMGGFA